MFVSVCTAVAAEAAEVTLKIAALIIRFPPSQHGPRMTIIIIALISRAGPGERRDTSHGSRVSLASPDCSGSIARPAIEV